MILLCALFVIVSLSTSQAGLTPSLGDEITSPIILMPSGLRGEQQWIVRNEQQPAQTMICFICPYWMRCSPKQISADMDLQARPRNNIQMMSALSRWGPVRLNNPMEIRQDNREMFRYFPQQYHECLEFFRPHRQQDDHLMFVLASFENDIGQRIATRSKIFDLKFGYESSENTGLVDLYQTSSNLFPNGQFQFRKIETPFVHTGSNDLTYNIIPLEDVSLERYGLERTAPHSMAQRFASLLDLMTCVLDLPFQLGKNTVPDMSYLYDAQIQTCVRTVVDVASRIRVHRYMIDIAFWLRQTRMLALFVALQKLELDLNALSNIQQADIIGVPGLSGNFRFAPVIQQAFQDHLPSLMNNEVVCNDVLDNFMSDAKAMCRHLAIQCAKIGYRILRQNIRRILIGWAMAYVAYVCKTSYDWLLTSLFGQ
jgi:hypothetical protein